MTKFFPIYMAKFSSLFMQGFLQANYKIYDRTKHKNIYKIVRDEKG